MWRLCLALVAGLGAAACSDEPTTDAGLEDAAISDAGIDAGPTCTSTTIPTSKPDIDVVPPYTYALPQPTGPHAVGTRIIHLRDPSRAEPREPADARPIVIQVFYPTDVRAGAPAPLMEPAIEQWFVRGGLPASFDAHLKTNAIFDVPLAATPTPMPVVLYTHGIQGWRFENQGMLEELASRGYFVVALSIVYSSTLVVLEDGRTAATTVPPLPGTPAEELSFYTAARKRMTDDWLPDLRFVLDQLDVWGADPCSWLGGRIATDRVLLCGYSFGGASSIELCLADDRCQGALSFDGPMFSSAPASTEKPIMILLSDRSDLSWIRMSEHLTGDVWQVRVSGSGHSNNAMIGSMVKTYFPELDLTQLGYYGPIHPDRALSIIHAYGVSFVEQVLSARNEPLLAGPSPSFPEAIYEDAEAGAWSDPFAMFGQVIAAEGTIRTPIVGATVTGIGSGSSTVSDARGRYRLDGFAGEGLVGARLDHPAIFPTIVSAQARGRNLPELPINMLSPMRMAAAARSARVELRPDRGHVAVVALRTVAEQTLYEERGVRVVSTSTLAPTFYSTRGRIDPRLEATDDGVAWIFNVAPGTWTATVGHPSLSCFALPGGPPEQTGEVDAIVEAGTLSIRAIGCE